MAVKTHFPNFRLILAALAGLISIQSAFAQSDVKVTWIANAESDIAGYKVYRGTVRDELVLADTVTSGTESRLGGLTPATTYFFAVQAYNTSGLFSKLSTPIAFTTAPVFKPEIDVSDASGSPMSSNARILIDSAALGTSASVTTLTIQNAGNADLSQLSFALGGAHPGDFEVSSSGYSSLAPSAFTQVQITFTPAATGNRTALLSISSNDEDENPFVIHLAGEGTEDLGVSLPEIVIQRSDGINLADAATLGFGATDLGTSAGSQSLTIRNTGSADLTGLSVSILGNHVQDFGISGLAGSVLAPGETAVFTVSFSPRAAGVRNAAIQILSNDANESPFNMVLSGVGVAHPEIAISNAAGSQLIDQTASLGLGSVNLGASGFSQTLTIANTGTGPLTGIAISLDGANPGDFGVSGPAAATLNPGSATTVTITFVPKAAGTRTATLHVKSNDADETSFAIALAGTGVAIPEIGIETSTATNLTDGSATVAFGSVQLGSSGSVQTLTIRNHGTGNLSGLSATVEGSHSSEFNVTSLASTSLAPGATMALAITFKPLATGLRSAFVRIASNDADENPFDISVNGTGIASPEIAVEKADASPLTDAGIGLTFGALNVSAITGMSQTITIRSTGNAALTGITATIDGSAAADFKLSAAPPSSLNPGTSSSLVILFKPTAAGPRSATLRIASNDADESPFDISLSGSGLTWPEIGLVKQDLTPLGDGASLAFGSLNLGPSTSNHSITIRNTGDGTLTGIAITVTGANSSDFVASALSSSNIAPGGSLSFTVTFKPWAPGNRSASLRIASNDADENPYDLNLSGTGVGNPEITVIDQNSNVFTDDSGMLAFGAAPTGFVGASQILTIRNQGTGDLTGLAASIDGRDASDFVLANPLPASLAPGAETTLTIGFKPSATGSRSATLRIASNDADERSFDLSLAGTGVAMPEISVETSDAVPLIDGASMPFATVNLGQGQVTRSIAIRNTGNAILKDLSLKLVGNHSTDFKVSALTATSLAPGAMQTFTLSFHPSSGGTRSAILHITSNDEDESNFGLALYGTGTSSPEIAVENPGGIPLSDGTGSITFGPCEIGGNGLTQNITIRNTGSGSLSLSSLIAVGPHNQDFTFGKLPASLAPRTSVALSIVFRPGASGTRSALLRIANNDPDENPFEIALIGTGVPVPEIAVASTNTPDLRSGVSSVTFAPLTLTAAGSPRLFTIRNQGSADLTGLMPVIIGANTSDFILTSRPSSTVSPGDTTSFEVTFNPSTHGLKAAVLKIPSNDADENPFLIDLTGNAVSLPAIHVTRSDATGISANLRTHTFGQVELRDSSAPVAYIVSNRGTANLTNLSIQLTGLHAPDFILGRLATTTLAPGASTTFTASFLPKAGGERQATLRILSNDPIENPLLISLSGIGITSPEITLVAENGTELSHGQAELEFGNVVAGSAGMTKSITIHNTGTEPLTGLKLELMGLNDSGFFANTLRKSLLVPTDSTTIQITFAPKLAGSQNVSLKITSSDPDENPYIIGLSGTGIALPTIVVKRDPRTVMQSGVDSVSFGSVALGGEGSSRSLTCLNAGNAPLTIVSATLAGKDASDFSISGFQGGSLAPDASRNLSLFFAPKSPGNKSAILRISSNDPNQPAFVISLNGSATGTPRIEVLNGKTRLSNQSEFIAFAPASSKVFTIANRGNSPLTGISVQTSGGKSSDFVISPFKTKSLAPGNSISFKVTFKPKPGGDAYEQLRITSNDPTARAFDMVLTASAKTPKSRRIPNKAVTRLQTATAVAESALTSTVMIAGQKYRCITIDRNARPKIVPGDVEVSPDLIDWSSGSRHITVMINSPTILKIRDNTPLTGGSKRFIRIRKIR